MIKRLLDRIKHHRFCKLNNYYCPDCVYHDFIFDGAIFRGNRCRWAERKEMTTMKSAEEFKQEALQAIKDLGGFPYNHDIYWSYRAVKDIPIWNRRTGREEQ